MKKLFTITFFLALMIALSSSAFGKELSSGKNSDLRYLGRLEAKLGALVNENISTTGAITGCAFRPMPKDALLPASIYQIDQNTSEKQN